jgi:hypothetical protein
VLARLQDVGQTHFIQEAHDVSLGQYGQRANR